MTVEARPWMKKMQHPCLFAVIKEALSAGLSLEDMSSEDLADKILSVTLNM